MSPTPSTPGPRSTAPSTSWLARAWRLQRWRYAFVSFLIGVAYSALAYVFGLEVHIGERDFSFFVGGLIEVSFAVFGYSLGLTIEARRGESRAAEEAQRRLSELSDLRARLAHTEKLAVLGQLASAVAHEVRNPLAILRSMAQNLNEELETTDDPAVGSVGSVGSVGECGYVAEGARQVCTDMIEEIDRLARVTSRLVDFSRPMVVRRAGVDVAELAQRVRQLSDLQSDCESPETVLETSGPGDCRLEGDADLICQLLLGLVDNARKASPPPGHVFLGWAHSANHSESHPDDHSDAEAWPTDVDLWVSDEGPGVPAEQRDKIFEPFFTTRVDGHGLGLAVAQQIAAAHGGQLWVEDAQPHAEPPGARFVLRLPLTASPALDREMV